ncbi:helix-turn-helix domain-containing protein [Methylocapsa polymorpha]|uniref:Helix-turn-helix domain-containing protein n=1 Tax=Methylocapsa polymorpha TaxID=3080828 RepID=A0ABZ0HSF3_9HYPH|nr:helix-turn-helix domain-containing protein [Methylocapsa sp. RX1]
MASGVKLSTEDLPIRQRRDWLREVIGREYANVEIMPPAAGPLFNEMTIYPWSELRLSSIRSNAIGIERLPNEPMQNGHDAYFAVVLLSGEYKLEQDGREVFLQPGDMTLYDATRPHRIFCPASFSKLIVSIPRPLLKERLAGVERCTAQRIPGNAGMGAVTADFIRSTARRAGELPSSEFAALSEHCADFLTLTLASMRQEAAASSRNREMTLSRIKQFVERNLRDPDLDAAAISSGVGLSSRYVNDIFKDEGATLMRYVWMRRLENCRKDLLSSARAGHSISDIAFTWGFNDLAHFSRSFKERFGVSPRDYRRGAAAAPGRL